MKECRSVRVEIGVGLWGELFEQGLKKKELSGQRGQFWG